MTWPAEIVAKIVSLGQKELEKERAEENLMSFLWGQ